MKLKQVRYHKFQEDILIYHYQESFLSVSNLRSLLNRHDHGYVQSLLSDDPFADTPVPPGDETPPGCLEVGYLRDVFQLGGSALGFRMGDAGGIEWLCFDRDIKMSFLDRIDIDVPSKRMLFEHVADLARSETCRKSSRKLAYTDHKDWFDALLRAGRKKPRLGLTWRRFGTELRDEHLRRRERRAAIEGDATIDSEVGGAGVLELDGHTRQRDADSPETVGRQSLVYRGAVPDQQFVSPQSSRAKHSRSSSSNSVLSDRSTNIPRTQSPSITKTKSKEKRLLNGEYV
jgi:hypothetical protein